MLFLISDESELVHIILVTKYKVRKTSAALFRISTMYFINDIAYQHRSQAVGREFSDKVLYRLVFPKIE